MYMYYICIAWNLHSNVWTVIDRALFGMHIPLIIQKSYLQVARIVILRPPEEKSYLAATRRI